VVLDLRAGSADDTSPRRTIDLVVRGQVVGAIDVVGADPWRDELVTVADLVALRIGAG
jgi:hypothetical protein